MGGRSYAKPRPDECAAEASQGALLQHYQVFMDKKDGAEEAEAA